MRRCTDGLWEGIVRRARPKSVPGLAASKGSENMGDDYVPRAGTANALISSRSYGIVVAHTCVLLSMALALSGCADFFAEKATEVQSENILRDLSRIRVLPDPNIVEPHVYTEPPFIMREADHVKLFYFVRNQTAADLASLVKEQYGYAVSQVSATNQLIIKCKTADDANSTLEFLREVDVTPVQVRIDCIVSELYADVTMDWETTLLIQNLFGEQIVLGGKVDASGNPLPAFPGASIRDEARSAFGLKVGVNRGVEGHKFLALIDMLVSRGYLKIMMSPSLEVVNGKTATIETLNKVPLQRQVTSPQLLPYNITEYHDVIDSLQITPHVFADGYIGLETQCTIGSKSTPEGVRQVPIITKREVRNAENRIRQGESLVIGGIKKTEKRSVVRGVPFLKDLPLIGLLFSSKDFEERANEVIFIITPSISSGGIPQAAMVSELARKQGPSVSGGTWTESLLDPFGLQAKQKQKRRAAELAEDERINAERARARAEKAEAEARALQLASEQANIEREKAQQLKAQAVRAQAEAKRMRASADKAQAEAQRAAAEAEKASKEAEAAQDLAAASEARKASAEAERKRAEAEKAAAQSQESMAQAAVEKARAEADAARAQAQAEEARAQAAQAEAERARADAERARTEAEKVRSQATPDGGATEESKPSEPNAVTEE